MKTSWKRSKIDELHHEIRQIDEGGVVPPPAKQRAALLEELNDLEPPISVLPPEIPALIFHFTRPSGFFTQNFRVTVLFCSLTLVSKHWRWVLLSNPTIWTEVDLRISRHKARRDANPLLPFITHSGQVPLSLGFQYHPGFGVDNKILIHPSVDPSLIESFGRVTRLRLRYPPLEWFTYSTLFKQTTHLALYEVRTPSNLPLSLDHAISLTVRDSPGIRLASGPLITTLNLSFMSISSSFYIFSNCPSLRVLHLSCQFKDKDPGYPISPFTLPHLQDLQWEIYISKNDQWYTAILDHIRLPSLQSLKWEEEGFIEYDIVRRPITGFFSRLPTTLTSLKFLGMTGASKWSETIEDICPFPPMNCQLESIQLTDCPILYFWCVLQKLQATRQFPRLRTIKTRGLIWPPVPWRMTEAVFDDQVEKNIARTCLTMLRKRMNVLNRQFILDLEKADLGWWKKVEGGLEEFKPDGRKVEIVRTGSMIVLST